MLYTRNVYNLATLQIIVPLVLERQELAPAQARVRHHREQPPELAHRQHIGERLALLRCPQRQRRVADEALLLDEEAEEALQRRRPSSILLWAASPGPRWSEPEDPAYAPG